MACMVCSWRVFCRRSSETGLPSTAFVDIRCASRACYQDVIRKQQKGARKPSERKLMIATQIRDTFTHHNMVAVYHYNSLNAQEWNGLRLRLTQCGIQMKIFPSKIATKALEETRYRNISPLFKGATAIAFAREPSAVKDLLSVTKSESKLHLLGGIVEDKMMTPLGVEEYGELPPLEVVQQMIVGTLTQTQHTLMRYIQNTSQKLSQLLTQISSDSKSASQQ